MEAKIEHTHPGGFAGLGPGSTPHPGGFAGLGPGSTPPAEAGIVNNTRPCALHELP
jgi:hypothetical protein